MDVEYRNSACSKYETLLEDSVSGEIGGADAARLSAHLTSCAGCRGALETAALSARLLRLGEATADPGPGFSRDVMARIRADNDVRAERGFWQPLISVAWRFAATATLALAVLVAYDSSAHSQPQLATTAPAEAAQIPDMFPPDPGHVPTSRDEVLMMVAENEHGKH